MPRYEFSDGSSNKFWEITVEGSEYTVHYGRIGTAGQTKTKGFSDPATAQKKADAAAAGKVRKGYRLIDAGVEQAKDEAVQDLLVLADKLQEAGDPRGQLISIMHRMQSATGAERTSLNSEKNALLKAHPAHFEGPRTDPGKRACSTVEWALGYWDRLTVFSHYDHESIATEALLTELLAHPSAARIHYLKLAIPHSVWGGESNWQPVIDALVRAGAPTVQSLDIADDDDNAEISWCEIGNLSAVWRALPELRQLRVRGVGITFGEIHAPKLQKLEIVSGGLPSEPVRRIGEATLPDLAHLEIYLGTDEYGANTTLEDCAGILAGKGLPKVTRLGLKNGEIMNELAAALGKAPIVAQLTDLDLSLGTMTDDGAKALIAQAAAFKHLKSLDVSENFLTAPVVKDLKKALPNVIANEQKDAYEDGDDEPWYYTSVAE